MADLPLDVVELPDGAVRPDCLPRLYSVRSGLIHPLRLHCFAGSRWKFSPKEVDDIRILPDSAKTYVYCMESSIKDIQKRHMEARKLQFDKPMAAGLLEKGQAC